MKSTGRAQANHPTGSSIWSSAQQQVNNPVEEIVLKFNIFWWKNTLIDVDFGQDRKLIFV